MHPSVKTYRFMCPLIGGLVCCLQFAAVRNKAAVNICTNGFVDIFSLLLGIVGSYGESVFNVKKLVF